MRTPFAGLAGLAGLLALAGCRAETTGPVEAKIFRQVATSATGASTCGLREGGDAFCWGANDAGQLGDGTDRASAVPVPAGPAGRGFTALAVGAAHACGLAGSGEILCWGRNAFGALGRGDSTVTAACPVDTGFREACAAPQPIAAGERFRTVGAGRDFTCGLTTAGGVLCWGDDELGQLGIADTSVIHCGAAPAARTCTATPLPVPFAADAPLASLAVGYGHACVLDAAGAAWCWGNGVLGREGPPEPVSRPTPLATDVAFTQIAAGGGTCALTAAGAAWCWGPVVADTTAARPVTSPHAFTSLSVGASEACALTATGAAFCWSLADLVPAQVPARLAFESLSAGAGYRCGAVRVVGAYCWGANAAGQLGDGTTADRAEPTFVTGQY